MRISLINKIFNKIEKLYAKTSSERFVRWLKKKGVTIGENVTFHQRKNVTIDLTRPSLIEIGNDVNFTYGLTLLTHGYDWVVLLRLFNELFASSGRIKIGNNVFVGYNATILKGVTIGDNCIIGSGSVVTRNIPGNSVAAGNPAKVICTIEEYYQKRKGTYIDEAKDYARSIKKNFGRQPDYADFWEEFPIFLDGNEMNDDIPIKKQLGNSFSYYHQNHKSVYANINDFLKDCGLI